MAFDIVLNASTLTFPLKPQYLFYSTKNPQYKTHFPPSMKFFRKHFSILLLYLYKSDNKKDNKAILKSNSNLML